MPSKMKTVARFTSVDKQSRVMCDHDWNGYVVRFYTRTSWSGAPSADINGWVHMDASDYYTEDGYDALDTARHAIEDERDWTEANNL